MRRSDGSVSLIEAIMCLLIVGILCAIAASILLKDHSIPNPRSESNFAAIKRIGQELKRSHNNNGAMDVLAKETCRLDRSILGRGGQQELRYITRRQWLESTYNALSVEAHGQVDPDLDTHLKLRHFCLGGAG